jgi:hypothetical protein
MEALGIGAASFWKRRNILRLYISGKPDGVAGTPKRNKKSAVLKNYTFYF